MSETNPTPAFRLGRGRVIGGYRLTRPVGRGWESTSYLAVERLSGVSRRLKFYRVGGEDDLPLIGHIASVFEALRETGAVVQYHHVDVWRRGRNEIIPYIAFDYVEGKPMSRLLEAGVWSPEWTARIALGTLIKVAEKLQAVHDLGWAVGDFAAGKNLLIRDRGEPVWCDLDAGAPGEPNLNQAGDFEEYFALLDATALLRPRSGLITHAVKRLERIRARGFRADTMREIAERLSPLIEPANG